MALVILFPTTVAAQEPVPSFTLVDQSAPPGYTNTTSPSINWISPTTITDCPSGDTCHFEYCFTESSSVDSACVGNWNHTIPPTFYLGPVNGTYTVYSEYRILAEDSSGNYTAYPSSPSSYQITLNGTTPTVFLNSPSGLPDRNYTGGMQLQWLNAVYSQPVTYAAGNENERVTGSNQCMHWPQRQHLHRRHPDRLRLRSACQLHALYLRLALQ